MNFRKITFAVATIAAFAPVISNASPERAALDACAHAFASSLAAPGTAAPTYKVDYRGIRHVGSVTEFYAREYTFDLYANDQKTGLPIAHARCSTDTRGAVVALSSIPLEAPRSLAAKL
jgi:hypothetical protein